MSNSLWLHGLYSPWNSPRLNTGVGSQFPSPGDLPDPGIKLGSPALHVDSVPAELLGKPIWPNNPTPGHISGENSNLERYMCSNVHWSTGYNSQYLEADSLSLSLYIYMYVCSGILLSHKKNVIMSSEATWVDLEIIILILIWLSEVS